MRMRMVRWRLILRGMFFAFELVDLSSRGTNVYFRGFPTISSYARQISQAARNPQSASAPTT